MKVVKTKKIGDCLESVNAIDVLYDSPVTKEFIEHLGKLGKLFFYEGPDKAMYKVIVRAKYTLKGSQGNKTSRILLPENYDDGWIEQIKDHVEKY